MVKTIIIILLFMSTWSAFAGTNLLDLLKSGKAAYSTAGCTSFIQSANHQTLISPVLQTLSTKAQNSRFVDDYYFHYTNAAIVQQTLKSSMSDRVAAQADILKNGGYKSIIQYQMTYSDALSNVSGVGFYVAANPFSSLSYGSIQVALKVDGNAVFFDKVKYATDYAAAVRKVTATYPAFAGCNANIQFSLLMNENNIDIVLYDDASEWLVVFNEDIFVQSRLTNVAGASANTLISKLIANGDGAAVIEYIKDLNLNKNFGKITMDEFFKMLPPGSTVAGQALIVKLAETLKNNWSDTLKNTFAKLVANRSGTEMTSLMNDLANSNLVPAQTYLDISLNGTSNDFKQWVASRIRQNPSDAKNWKAGYEANVIELLKKDFIDLKFIFANAPVEFSKDKFYKSYNSYGLSKNSVTQVLDYMVANDPTAFTALDKEARYVVFNDYLKNADVSSIPAFTASMEQLGYDSVSSFNYIARRSSQFGANGISFMISYIKLRKDPNLLTDAIITLFVSNKDLALDMLIYLKQNQVAFGAGVSKYSDAYLSKLTVAELGDLMKPNLIPLFDRSEKDFMFDRILSNEDTKTASLVRKFVQSFAYSSDDIMNLLVSSAPVANAPGIEALQILQKDSTAWAKFTDLKNANGILTILKLDKTYFNLQSYIVDQAPDALLKDPESLPAFNPTTMNYILQASRVRPYYANYSDAQKLNVARQMRTFNSNEAKEFMAGVTYSAAMVQANLSSLLSADNSSDLEDLLNNPSFVANLSDADFSKLVKSITSYKNEINMRTLIRSDVLTLNKAIILAFAIDKTHGSDNLNELLDHELKFEDLPATDKNTFVTRYISDFATISSLARNTLWDELFAFASSAQKDLLVSGYKSMSLTQQSAYLAFYATSSLQVKKGIDLFHTINSSMIEEALNNDKVTTVTKVIEYVEANYPLKDEPYALHMINNMENLRESSAVQSLHMQKFVCKKVKKFYAFDDILDNTQDKEVKKALKEKRKLLCN